MLPRKITIWYLLPIYCWAFSCFGCCIIVHGLSFGWKLLVPGLIDTVWKEIYPLVIDKCYSIETWDNIHKHNSFYPYENSCSWNQLRRFVYRHIAGAAQWSDGRNCYNYFNYFFFAVLIQNLVLGVVVFYFRRYNHIKNERIKQNSYVNI